MLKSIIRLIRLENLLFLTILIGVMVKWVVSPIMASYQLADPLTWWQLLLLIVAVVFIAAGGYVINDYFDVKIDRINHPDDLIVTRTISKQQAMYIFYGLTAVGVLSGVALSYVLRSSALLTLFVVTPGVLWFYSASYKRQFLVGNLVIAALAGLVPVLVGLATEASIRLQYGSESMAAQFIVNQCYVWLLGFAGFAFLCTWAREIIKDLEDQEGDRELECHTFPVRFGTRASQVFVTFLLLLIIGLISWVQFRYMPPFAWSSMVTRFYIFLVVGFVGVLALLWAARLPQDFRTAQLLLKMVMFVGMLFSFCARALV